MANRSWVEGKTLDGKPESIKVSVKLVICTHLNHGKKYPHCSLGNRPTDHQQRQSAKTGVAARTCS